MNSVFTTTPCGDSSKEKKCFLVGVANWLSNREISVKKATGVLKSARLNKCNRQLEF
jgi:hypothetical protein